MSYLFEVELRSPLIVNQTGLPLESLLAASVYESTGKIKDEAVSETTIKHELISQFKTYKSSCAFFSDRSFITMETIVRRRRNNEIGEDFYAGKKMRAKLKPSKNQSPNHPWLCNQASGSYKALMNDYRVINTNNVMWLAETDEPDRVVDMLLSLGWIGKRRGQGFGEIGGAFYRDVGDESPLIDCNGKPRRVMPVEVFSSLPNHDFDGVTIAPSKSYAASAWENQAVSCVIPNQDALNIGAMFQMVDEDNEIFYG